MRVRIPDDAQRWLGREQSAHLILRNRLGAPWEARVERTTLATEGLALPDLPPCEAMMIELSESP